VSLRQAWEEVASQWIAWAREPGFDSYWRFHRDRFLEIVPPPGRCTLDAGCGEGRLSRDLAALGHEVIGVDGSPTLIAAARAADPGRRYDIADLAALPFADGAFDLAVAFMSLHDVDDLTGAVRECARVLEDGGVLCAAIVHPINSAGEFGSDEPGSPFVIADSYLSERTNADHVVRDGLEMTFHSRHRTIERYITELAATGFAIDALREHGDPYHPQWSRVPLFLHLRARISRGRRTR
jgi:SAM-dependent methyltransferase